MVFLISRGRILLEKGKEYRVGLKAVIQQNAPSNNFCGNERGDAASLGMFSVEFNNPTANMYLQLG